MKEILLLLVMFWNLENFFDPFENGPYTPTGEKFWTWKKFAKKRDDIARTICLAAEGNGTFPAIIGLCEVENRLVLNQLTQNTNLAKLNYGVIHKDSPDRRGIDAALLYRKELFTPLRVRFIPTLVQAQDAVPAVDTLPSRETVYVKGVFMGLDTLHCFVVHWPSKLGGKESLQNRMAASECLKKITDSILCADSRANIIVMGDFNDSPQSEAVANLDNLVNMSVMERVNERVNGGANEGANGGAGSRAVRRRAPQERFTYKYKEEWSRIDHFLVSPWMYAEKPGMRWLYCDRRSSGVFAHRFLLEIDEVYLGYKVRRTMVGPRYNGGVSDHLPILLRVWGYEY